MTSLAITTTTWIVWAVIGIIAGYMTGRLIGGGRRTALNVIVGIVGAVLGGWLFVASVGDSENNQIISLLTSLFVSGVFLWILTIILPKPKSEDDENTEE